MNHKAYSIEVLQNCRLRVMNEILWRVCATDWAIEQFYFIRFSGSDATAWQSLITRFTADEQKLLHDACMLAMGCTPES